MSIIQMHGYTVPTPPTPIFEYSYDFTTGSVADLQSKGWTVPSGNVVNSNGYYNSIKNRNGPTLTSADLGTATTNATSIVFTLTWSATSAPLQRYGFIKKNNQETVGIYGDGASAVGGDSATFGGSIVFSGDGSTYGNNGTYTTTLTVDLVNKTWEYTGTDRTPLNGTVTDAQITTFRGSSILGVYAEQSAYIKNIGVTIY